MKTILYIAVASMLLLTVTADKEHEDHGHGHSHAQGHQHPEDVEGEHDPSFDHDAILGKDGDKEFSDLPPEEAKEKLRLIALKMDKDGNGKVTRAELKAWIYNSFVKMDIDDASKRLEEYDGNQDSKLSWSEIMQNVYSYSEDDVKALKEGKEEENTEIIDMIDDDHKKFKLADVDMNGVLDKDEYATFEHPYNYDHMAEAEVDRMLKDNDKDKDGQITFEEYKMTMGTDGADDDYDKEQFANLDKDKNQILDRAEVAKWSSPDNDESASEEADHLIEHADSDSDKELTIDEIVDNHELFVGSQATDYGNYLHKHVDEL